MLDIAGTVLPGLIDVMTARMTQALRLGAALLAGGAVFGVGLSAPAAALTVSTPTTEDSGTALTRHLRTLSTAPRNLEALIGAGTAALDLGDPQAALTFFGRAEEVAPRDGRVKASMASAFVQLEQPEAALKFFAAAASFGISEGEFAADRGLAYDLSGNPRRAQADYALSLKRTEDDEVRRRLALSLAISGDRDAALKAIDAQLRRRDPAAWRARAFVLALVGDTAGATAAVQAVMPDEAAAIRPFLARLPSLAPAERALAVHFGHFPGEGPTYPSAAVDDDTRLADVGATDAGRPDERQLALGSPRNPVPKPVSTAPRRRPGTETATASPAPQQRPAAKTPPKAAAALPAAPPSVQAQAKREPMPFGPPTPGTPPALAAQGGPTPAEERAPAPKPAPRTSFADLAATIASLPEAPAPSVRADPAPRKEASKPAEKAAKPSAEKVVKPAVEKSAKAAAEKSAKKAKVGPAKHKEPSRIWVQVAGGANKHDLPRAYAKLKDKAPKLLGGRTPWTTPLRATNRLLVGPFKTEKEAREFVNQLAKADLGAFSWTSPEGQEVEKLSAK